MLRFAVWLGGDGYLRSLCGTCIIGGGKEGTSELSFGSLYFSSSSSILLLACVGVSVVTRTKWLLAYLCIPHFPNEHLGLLVLFEEMDALGDDVCD